MRVLLVEDDPTTTTIIKLMLEVNSFNVFTTDLGEEAFDLGKLYDFDIIVLDINLPDMNGFDVLRKLRLAGVKTPVLILSGRSEMEAKLRALGGGADDYLSKPFHREELIARIRALVRRSFGQCQAIVRTGNLAINLDAHTVEIDGTRIYLTVKEYGLLELLMLRKGITVTKETILSHLYGGMDEPEIKIVDVFLCKIRKKFRLAGGSLDYIETVWGRGYKLLDLPDENVAIAA